MDAHEVRERTLSTLVKFVEDWGLDVDIAASTLIVEDLEFDSIDVIQLTVALENEFESRQIGFQDLLMQDGRYVDDLRVQDIQVFLEARLL